MTGEPLFTYTNRVPETQDFSESAARWERAIRQSVWAGDSWRVSRTWNPCTARDPTRAAGVRPLWRGRVRNMSVCSPDREGHSLKAFGRRKFDFEVLKGEIVELAAGNVPWAHCLSLVSIVRLQERVAV